jgi:hypothetical protein
MGRWWSGALLLVVGCSSFASVDEPEASDSGDPVASSTSGTPNGTTTSPGSDDATGSDPAGGDPTNPSGADSQGSQPDPSGPGETSDASTGGEPSSTGEDESSTGDAGESTGATVITCDDLLLDETVPLTCSQTAIDGASLTVFNDCQTIAIDVYWVGYDCSEQYYGSADAGAAFSIGTYQTHPWRIRNAFTGELMREIPPLDGDTSVSVLMR